MKKTALCILFCLSCLLGLQAQSENSLLWEIRSPDGHSSWLFGTYHLINSGFLDEHQRVATAFEKASTVVVETVVDSSKLMAVSMEMMLRGKNMRDLLDSAEYALVDQELRNTLGMGLGLLGTLKPIAISTMYAATLAEQNMPAALQFEGQPIDLFFAADARSGGKLVVALESMEEQAALLFDSQDEEGQADDLVEMIREKEEALKVTIALIEAYREEELRTIARLAAESGEDRVSMSRLVGDRNRAWLKKLRDLLPGGGVFIAVGALHLSGEDGLIALLQKEGYTLTAIMP